jgi:DNA polymerase I-like protein with 3'-5' exonuclease and polymerase domains
MPVATVLFAMERHGVLIDGALLDAQGAELGKRMYEIEQQAYALAGARSTSTHRGRFRRFCSTDRRCP